MTMPPFRSSAARSWPPTIRPRPARYFCKSPEQYLAGANPGLDSGRKPDRRSKTGKRSPPEVRSRIGARGVEACEAVEEYFSRGVGGFESGSGSRGAVGERARIARVGGLWRALTDLTLTSFPGSVCTMKWSGWFRAGSPRFKRCRLLPSILPYSSPKLDKYGVAEREHIGRSRIAGRQSVGGHSQYAQDIWRGVGREILFS